MEYFFAAALLICAALDRFALKRREVEVGNVFYAGADDHSHRFVINFSISQPLISSSIVYTLRDVRHPQTVISGKPRVLDFSVIGGNEEYLLFPKHLIADGKWRLDIKISSHGSAINPFYKLFPITRSICRDFELKAMR